MGKKLCPQCGTGYAPTGHAQKFCSADCQYAASLARRHARAAANPKAAHICPQCKGEFRRNGAAQKWCSPECKAAANPPLARAPNLTCPQCGTVFTRTGRCQKFCSDSCRQKASRNRRRRVTQLAEIACVQCGGMFTPRRRDARYCSPACGQRFHYDLHNRKNNRAPNGSLPARIDDELVVRILSDGIFSGAIADELDTLRKSKSKAVATLKAILNRELVAPTWPHDRLGRVAVILAILSFDLQPGRFMHPHEKRATRGQYKPSGFILRAGGMRIK